MELAGKTVLVTGTSRRIGRGRPPGGRCVIHEPAPLADLPLAEWRRLFDTDVFGMVALLRAF